ncbi:hypothetical protein Ancab_033022 [Ancistrocladus abbreviatus]
MSSTTATFTSEPPPPQPPPHQHHVYYAPPPVTAILIILLLVLLFVGFFSLYFCKCFMENAQRANIAHNHQTQTGTAVNPPVIEPSGLDPSIINSFPTFPYDTVKSYRREKYGLECAICLCEFDDHDLLRLLTRCCHVFHKDCIDLWLQSHRSCPVCRRSLDEAPPVGVEKWSERETAPPASNSVHGTEENTHGSVDDTFSVVMIKDEEDEVHGRVGRSELLPKHPLDGEGKFSRSHSTGHSIMRTSPTAAESEAGAARDGGKEVVVVLEVEDRYTLRLPEHVKDMITRRHQASLSCTTFGELEKEVSRKHCCFGEISGGCPACGDTDHFDRV